jgi:hypothetical protein
MSKLVKPKLKQAIKLIQKRFDELKDEVVFCGSVGLFLNGMIDRQPNDIDCITRHNYYGMDGYTHLNYNGSGKFVVNSKQVECVYGKFGAYHVDFFYIRDYITDYSNIREMNFYGTTIMVEIPEFALACKQSYVANLEPKREGFINPDRDKHEADIIMIKKRLAKKRRV